MCRPASRRAKRKAGWTLITWMTSPEKSGWWSRRDRILRAEHGAYELPGHEGVHGEEPGCADRGRAAAYAKPWFATYKTVAVRKAIEDELQAMLSARSSPKEAIVAAQKTADEIMRPYVSRPR